MTVRLVNNNDREWWDNFVIDSPYDSFLQSWAWGELQGELGVPYWRLVAEEAGELRAVALVVRREVLWGWCWLYMPRGPVFSELSKVSKLSSKEGSVLQGELLELAKNEGAVFVRTEPAAVPRVGWQKADHDVQPAHTLVVDLTKGEEELLAGMHAKTRYNIRLAERRGVRVRFSADEKDLGTFLELAQDVATRSPFRYHGPEHYRAMLKVLAPAGMLTLAVAEYGGRPLAVYILVKFGNTVAYVHGASGSGARNVMAPHLLMWESIRRAKQGGAKHFDFFGVAPPGAGPDHPWAGITRFKEGFGGRRENYAGAYDLVRQPGRYAAFNLARRARGCCCSGVIRCIKVIQRIIL